MYRINEIFYSLQGEGYHTGTAVVFVRFAGCNLRCEWCDTDFASYTEMDADEIAAECLRIGEGCGRVVLTGGEPTLQADEELVKVLHKSGWMVHIETNGTGEIPVGIDWVTCSPKEGSRVVLTEADEVKVVYTGQDVERWRQVICAKHYFLQPCSCANTEETMAYILRHPVWRLSLQTHKYTGMR